MKQTNFVSCVVYLHNQEETIEKFMELLQTVMNENFENYEIVCVDDFSEDKTVEKLRQFIKNTEKKESISLIHMSYYQGREASMNAGRDLAVGDFVFEFDSIEADYEKDLIYKVYERSLEGYDIVSAAPKNHISISSKLFYFVYNRANKTNNKLRHERFRIVSRRAVNRVKQINSYIPYRKAQYTKCGLKMDCIRYDSLYKTGKKKNIQEKESRSDLAFDSFIIFTDVLEKISLILCGFFLFVMLATAGYVIWSLFGKIPAVEGWMSTIGLISFGFFGVFLLLTLILKYLSVILNLVFKKQRYIISDIEKLS